MVPVCWGGVGVGVGWGAGRVAGICVIVTHKVAFRK